MRSVYLAVVALVIGALWGASIADASQVPIRFNAKIASASLDGRGTEVISVLAKVNAADPKLRDLIFVQNIVGGGVYGDIKISVAGYSGPGDAVSGFKLWGSCARAYNAAYAAATGNLCDLVDTATGVATCTLKVKTSGFADMTSAVCVGGTVSVTTFCTVTHAAGCSVTKAYDQSGALNCSGSTACPMTQATLGSMPTLLLSALNGLPCIASAAGAGSLASPTFTLAQPFTYSAVAERTGAFTTFGQIVGGVSSDPSLLFRNTANGVALYAGGVSAALAATDSAFHAIQAAFNDAVSIGTSSGNVDGSSTPGLVAGTDPISSGVGIGNAFVLTGTVCEAGVLGINASAGQQTSLNTNQHSSTNGYNF